MTDKAEVRKQAEEYRELTMNQVAMALSRMSRELERLGQAQVPLEDDAVRKREAYILEYAKIFMGEEGNNEERKQATIKRTHELRLDAELAETLVKMHVQEISIFRKRIDIARSAAALVRAEWELQQVGGRARGG